MTVWTIARREVGSAFATPVGWATLCGWQFVAGFFWWWAVQIYVLDSQDLVFNPYAAGYLNLTDYLLQPFFGNLAVVLVFVVPALIMRAFAEERARHTLDLLLSSPITTTELVLGKYLGAWLVVVMLLGVTVPYPLTLYVWGSPELGAIAGGLLGLLLLASALLALGLWLSSLTSSPLVALGLGSAAGLGLLLVDARGGDATTWTAHLSLTRHLEPFAQGGGRLSDVVWFTAVAAFFVVATERRIAGLRWS